MILSDGNPLTFHDLTTPSRRKAPVRSTYQLDESLKLDDVMARHIRRVLEMAGGRVEGERGAAQLLAVKPGTLRQRMRKLGIPFGRNAKKRSQSTH